MSMVALESLASIPYRTFPSFKIGPVTVRTFGVFVAIGIVAGVWCLLRFARDHELDTERLSRLAVWVVALGLVGSRLLFVITRWSEFRHDLPSVFAVWQGGLQFSGAFLVAIVAIWWFSRRHPEFGGLRLSDGIVFGLAPGLAIGRLGCMAVGEHLGTRTSFFLGWKYLGGATREPVAGGVGSVIHNTAIYELLLLLPVDRPALVARTPPRAQRMAHGRVPPLVRDPAVPHGLPPRVRPHRRRPDGSAVPVHRHGDRRARARVATATCPGTRGRRARSR